MSDAIKNFHVLEKRIIDAQEKLRNKNQKHPLLSLVEVDEIGIHWTAEFGGKYQNMTAYN